MLLNNDTMVDPQLLRVLVALAGANPDVGIVTPVIYYYDEPQRIWCAGAGIDWRAGSVSHRRAGQIDQHQDSAPQDVDFASGCALCFKRAVIEQIGLIDPRFFIYYDETDWCVRARRAGWRILLAPDGRVWHRISAAMGTTSPATDYYMNRNVVLFVAKNRRGPARLVLVARVWLRNLLTVAAYTVKPHGGRRIPNRNARLLAARDALLGRWGEMGPDVAAVCYPDRR
jgi:GT2 family glycosyltransferase